MALDIWQNLNYSKVFADLPEERPSVSNRKLFYEWMKGSIRNRGLDVSPLKEVIRLGIDEEKIRTSDLDYGLVVFDLTNRKSKYLTISEIPEGQTH